MESPRGDPWAWAEGQREGEVKAYLRDIPVKEAAEIFFDNMPPHITRQVVSWLRKFVDSNGSQICVATAFAGSDIATHVLKQLKDILKKEFELEIDFKHVWSCESDEDKIRHVEKQVHPPHVFPDFSLLSNAMCKDSQGRVVMVPYADWLFAGIPCTSKSQMNRNRAQHTTCVQDDSGARKHTSPWKFFPAWAPRGPQVGTRRSLICLGFGFLGAVSCHVWVIVSWGSTFPQMVDRPSDGPKEALRPQSGPNEATHRLEPPRRLQGSPKAAPRWSQNGFKMAPRWPQVK